MKHMILPVCVASVLAAIPATASTIPAEWVGQDATLVFDFSSEILEISDDVFFGLGGDAPVATADTTPFFGLATGATVSGNLKLNVTFEDGFVDVTSTSCSLAGFECNYNDIASFDLTDPVTGGGSFSSTDFANATLFNFGGRFEGQVLAEWSGTSDLVIRALDLLILDFDVSGLPPLPTVSLVSVPLPSSLPLLGGTLTIALLGAGDLRRRKSGS